MTTGSTDRRFQDPAWSTNPYYRMWLDGYQAWGRWMNASVESAGLSPKQAGQARFFLGQIYDAMAPTNFFWGNPAAVRKAIETGGASTAKGVANWLDDLVNNGGMPKQVDARPFQVGKNLAVTPGAVVHRTEVFELIQYTPQTETVYSRPFLVIPPQVNRYYAMDLAPGRSLYEYLVNSGIQLFTIVWRNPQIEHREWGFDTYLQAIIEATDVIRQITRSQDVNALGACLGGMTLAMLLSHLALQGDRRINAAALGVTLLDASVESAITVLAEPQTLSLVKQYSESMGMISAKGMSGVFSWLRANDLVWNYWANNYLMGEDPPAFDVLAWNSDATNLPARLHQQLIDLIDNNGLTKSGVVHALGSPVDLRNITCDMYVVAAQTDHITPWKSCYAATQLLGGNTEFVLGSSGHIQTLVCPPDNPKARYFTNAELPADPEAWRSSATEHKGSWWTPFAAWLAERSGARRAAPKKLGNRAHPVLVPAPGTYVLES
jgi:poly[(R)-3-hydroxyalkanoate] polymerase subunit PhaC